MVRRGRSLPRPLAAVALALLLVGCATWPEDLTQGEPGYALPPQADGPLAKIESRLQARLGTEESGFLLLNSNTEALRWRLALIDSAEHSLDLQYYLWWGDDSGSLLIKRIVMAANRGVRVRILLDGLSMLEEADVLEDAERIGLRDAAAVMTAHPNIDVRLFNPWRAHSFGGRLLETILRLNNANRRMHNKLMIADNRAAIIGGRNIGDQYFGLSSEFNFRDLDALGIGPVARQASEVFDRFWNSDLVGPAESLSGSARRVDLESAYATISRRLEDTPALSHFQIDRRNWSDLFDSLATGMVGGRSRIYTDVPGQEAVEKVMPAAIRALLEDAESEVHIANAYLIPDGSFVRWIGRQVDRGIRYRVLTNSLASTTVPAVSSHYGLWRARLLEAGVELYETRADAAVKSRLADTPPVASTFMGLHLKAMVVDRRRIFIGSMNLDPRSWSINSEMGVVVESAALAEQLAAILDEDMRAENAWRLEQVEARGDGGESDVLWVAGDRTRRHQPARSTWQLFQEFVFGFFPRSLY